jgi:hypothetical protein
MNRPATRLNPLFCLCTLVFAAGALIGGPVHAGGARVPFATFEAGLDYASVFHENEFHDYWEPGAGFAAWAHTPVYAGDLHLGARYLFNRGAQPELPDFGSLYLYLGWSYPISVTGRFVLHPGAALGGNIMSFDSEGGAGIRYETEAAAELFVRAGFRPRDRWRINAAVGWQTMFTYYRIDQAWIQAGISRTFDMPGWLRGFLE